MILFIIKLMTLSFVRVCILQYLINLSITARLFVPDFI